MATQTYFFGLLGILGAFACRTVVEETDSGNNGNGGAQPRSTTVYVGQGGASNSQNPSDSGGVQATTSPFAAGGTSTRTSPLGSGGTSTFTTPNTSTINPNRTLTPTEATAVETAACNGWSIEPEATAGAKLELVVDVSSSMGSKAPGSNRTKWEVTRDALVEAIPGPASGGGLPASVSVGMMFYPNMRNDTVSKTPSDDPNVCINTAGEVKMAKLSDNSAGTHRNAVRDALDTIILGLGTPTATAYNYVLNNTVLTPEQLAIEGDAYMLLITDGMPTLYEGCYNPSGTLNNLEGDPVVAAVDAAFNRGVKTFIVGSPGSEQGRAWLSKAAFLGDTGAGGCNPDSDTGPYCHLDMTTAPDFSAALRAGLAQVMDTIVTCKYDIPATSADGTLAVDLNQISPIVRFSNGQIILVGKTSATGTTCSDGYRLIGTTQMELCKNTCSQIQSDAEARVTFSFGCAAASSAPPSDTPAP
jgi:hypothetical protein